MKRCAAATMSVMTVGLVGALTACSGSTPGGGSADGEGFVVAVRSGDNNVAPELVKLWNETNPDNPAQLEVLSGNSADAQRQQLTLELDAGGEDFDVLGMDVIWTGEFAENEWITPIEGADEVDKTYWEGALESGQYQGETYALPLLLGAGLLYYRTDVVDEAPASWSEFQELQPEIESQGMTTLVAQGAAYEGLVVNFLELYWGAGGEVYNEDHTELLFDRGIASEVLSTMKEYYEDGIYPPGFNTMTEVESRALFEQGDAAFMRHWVAPYRAMAEEEGSAIADSFDIAPLPTISGEGTSSALGGLNLAVSAFSDSPEAAQEFVLWASSDEEAQRLIAEAGLGPVIQETYEEPEYADDPAMQSLKQILPDARSRPAIPDWNRVSVALQQEVFDAYTGEKDIDSAVEAINAALESGKVEQ